MDIPVSPSTWSRWLLLKTTGSQASARGHARLVPHAARPRDKLELQSFEIAAQNAEKYSRGGERNLNNYPKKGRKQTCFATHGGSSSTVHCAT